MKMAKTYLPLVLLSLVSACSVWAANGEYEFVESECTQDLECSAAAFSTPTCNAGRCELACDDGRADCDDTYGNGCEADLGSTAACGTCGTVCEASDGNMPRCEAGACVVQCNAAEFLDCDMSDANGCEVDGTTTANCGACNARCADGELCNADAGIYTCILMCDAPRTICTGRCVDTDVNRLNCGVCGNVCGNDNVREDSTCLGGGCVLNCASGFDDCDGDPGNGCETAIDTAANCGRCGTACLSNNANPMCDTSGAAPVCTIVSCTDGYFDCNDLATDGCEIDSSADINNCGGCGTVCGSANTSSPSLCDSGACQLDCAVGFEDGDANPENGCEASIIVDIASGEHHSCVVRNGGEVYCTGYDAAFGVAGPRPPDEVLTPRRIVFSDDTPLLATALSAGEQHTCAIDTAGHLYCWGRNTNFRLGRTPEGAHSAYPVPVEAETADVPAFMLRTFVQVSTAEQHSCALDDLGGIWCWGNGAAGDLGLGDTADALARPVPGLPRPAVRVVTGTRNSAAILDDARVFGWGVNASGTLGLDPGVTSMVMTPTELFGGTPIRELAMGTSFACFIGTDDSLRCVGNNTQLRLGSGGGGTHIPRLVSVPGTPETLFAGPSHACALTSVGVSCWGHNDEGEVGAGTYSADGELPTSVVFPAGVAPSVLSDDGYYNACVIAGAAYCWGNNPVENLSVADDDWTTIGRPEAPDGSPLPLISITASSHHGCGATADSLYCWGDVTYTMRSGTAPDRGFYHEPLEVPLPAGVTSVVSVGAGLDHTCFVGNNGSVYCSGDNSAGELGVAGPGQQGPIEVVGLPADIEEVVASANSTCARTASAVHCFGETVFHPSSAGRDLDRVSGGSSVSTPIPDLADAVQLVAGRAFNCAIRSAGEVRCWGWDNAGQRGDGAEDDGIVNLPMPAISIAASTAHACAVLMDGRVMCWGSATAGRVGNNTSAGNFIDPVFVEDAAGTPITGAVDVGAIEGMSCAVLGTGAVMCWGDSRFGQLGSVVSTDHAVMRPDITDALTAQGGTGSTTDSPGGAVHMCFMRSGADGEGPVGCIGNRNHGRMGDQTSYPRVSAPMRYRGFDTL